MTIHITPAEQAAMDRETALADKLVDLLWSRSEKAEVDPVGVSYSVFLAMAHTLFDCGWTAGELSKDISDHKVIHEANEQKLSAASGESSLAESDEPPDDDPVHTTEALVNEALVGMLDGAYAKSVCGHCAAQMLFVKVIQLLKDTGMEPAAMQKLLIWHTADDVGPRQ